MELEKRYLLVVEQAEIKIGIQFFSQYRFARCLADPSNICMMNSARANGASCMAKLPKLSKPCTQIRRTGLPCNWPAIMKRPGMPRRRWPI